MNPKCGDQCLQELRPIVAGSADRMEIFLCTDSAPSELQSGGSTLVSRGNRVCRANRGHGAEASAVVVVICPVPHQGFGFWSQESQLLGLQGNMWPWAPPVPSGQGQGTHSRHNTSAAHRLDNERSDKLPHRPGMCPVKPWREALDTADRGGVGQVISPRKCVHWQRQGAVPRLGQGFGRSLDPAPAPGQREG